VKVVEAKTPPPVKAGNSLGGISLGGIVSMFNSSTNKDTVPRLDGERAPIGLAVVEVGGLEVDDPSIDLNKKK
jgi:hypothetical protein